LRSDRLRYKVCGLAIGGAVAVAAAAGCSSPASSSGSTSAAGPAGSPRVSQSTGDQPTGQPSADQTYSPPDADGPVSSAQRAAEAVQGPAAVPTAAQLAALDAESGVIARMSPEQLAGQRVIYSYRGLKAPARLLSLIRHGDVGGVIFFSSNMSSQAQLSGVIGQMVAANASKLNPARKYPLLLMTDQEGGEVRRLQWAGPDQSEAQIGASPDPAAAAATAGAQAASGLRGVGINVNLAPVLDVYRKPGDFDDQFQRSYSMNPDVVAQAGAAFITSQQQGGVAATVKHFPGLGAAAATQDTDNKPVRISLSASTLRSVDELPYESAFRAGVKLTMVSWANYPALAQLPAGLSVAIVQGELRQRLGFTGVTITDALGAGALRAYGSLENKTMLAGRAGMDALLCTGVSPLPGWKCVAGLEDGYTDGALPTTAFRAQLAQLLQLRASLPT
jgi:beta-N-acetylhexosaminidase